MKEELVYVEKLAYVMVTHWDKHWDNIPGNTTCYTKREIRFNLQSHQLKENAPTLFIKVEEKTYEMEKAWFGYVSNFKPDVDKQGREKISFNVEIKKELDLKEALNIIEDIDAILQPKSNPKPGWYLVSQTRFQKPQIKSSIIIPEEFALYPPFFYNLIKTKDHLEFEDLVFQLLKLIGINDICKIDRRKQKGKSDGIFVLGNLVVMYDCTLQDDYERDKLSQIDNFCNQLANNANLNLGKLTLNIQGKNKQVWIVTRGETRIIDKRKFNNNNILIIKEISIYKLIEIYIKRIKENLFEDELEKILENLGN